MAKKEYAKYKCSSCKYRFRRVWNGYYPSLPCPKCGENAHIQFDVPKAKYDPDLRRKPMTEQEKRLIGFYQSEKRWHEDIMSRRVVPKELQKKYGTGVIRVPPGKAAPWE